jgi:sulfide:quinone oxidoreductase
LRASPATPEGFIPTDPYGRVEGLDGVFAAGDATTFPVKQGGIATEQADVVAQSIAALAGALVTPEPFRPVLRGLLLTGSSPGYLQADLRGDRGEASVMDVEPLWWPPSKIAGHHLSCYFATLVAAEPVAGRHPDSDRRSRPLLGPRQQDP